MSERNDSIDTKEAGKELGLFCYYKIHILPVKWYGGLVAKSCLALCNHMDYRPPGSSVHGILQARILEVGAISFSRGTS